MPAVHDAAKDAGALDALLVQGDGRGYHGRNGHALEAAVYDDAAPEALAGVVEAGAEGGADLVGVISDADDYHGAGGDEDAGGKYRGGRDDQLDAEEAEHDEDDRDEDGASPGAEGRDNIHDQQRRAVDGRRNCREDDDDVEDLKRNRQRRVRLPQLTEGVVIVVKAAQSGKLHDHVYYIGKYAHGYKREYYGCPAVIHKVAQNLVAGCEAPRRRVCQSHTDATEKPAAQVPLVTAEFSFLFRFSFPFVSPSVFMLDRPTWTNYSSRPSIASIPVQYLILVANIALYSIYFYRFSSVNAPVYVIS